MSDNAIPLFETVPLLNSKRCKFFALLLRIFLQYTLFILPLGMWYRYDIFIAFLSLVLTFIVMGIIRSKLRNDSIPFIQREFHYNDDEIARWYIAKRVCN